MLGVGRGGFQNGPGRPFLGGGPLACGRVGPGLKDAKRLLPPGCELVRGMWMCECGGRGPRICGCGIRRRGVACQQLGKKKLFSEKTGNEGALQGAGMNGGPTFQPSARAFLHGWGECCCSSQSCTIESCSCWLWKGPNTGGWGLRLCAHTEVDFDQHQFSKHPVWPTNAASLFPLLHFGSACREGLL